MFKSSGIILGALGAIALTACSKDEPILPGAREGIRDVSVDPADIPAPAVAEDTARALALPPARSNANWLQSISSPGTRTDHPALSAAPNLAWSVSIGAGDGRKNRITADPVVGDGRIYTLDAEARVTAVSTSGQVLWTTDMVPPNDSRTDASGGGLAYANGTLYVSSGFGLMTALDGATGAERWQQNLRATGSGSPTVSGDLVYLVAGDEVAWALETSTGRIRWQLAATPDINNVMGGPAPAVTDKYVVFAFGSGELQGAFRKGGLRLWDAQIAGQRPGYSAARIGDITGDPVVVGDTLYAGSHSGRTVALGLGNGKRKWTANDGALNPVWPTGDSVFMISDRNELIRLNAEDGTRIWGKELPFFTKDRPRRQAEIFAHHGPIIAGGNLIVASSDAQLRLFDPVSGALRRSVSMPGGASTNPVVAGNTLYVVTTKGQLAAFR
ncbi:PQQ-like beta-propeller repeat protein [uncultured Roseovarius sp.]|uniref:PQQ-like beta-propeller repeat protein n=1 Tax=uncultured Roseovarius sp. TaxID=293344 RepID=UPI0026367D99|nr:PQQ-like beta-propeller repeat protein [uncultured Roseovarius sp.]